MNLRDLHYLITVAELKSFSQAAEYCHVSQPTLSSQIKKLETTLDIPLFERTHKKVMPTDTCLKIVEAAKRILHEVDTIHQLAELSQDPLAGLFHLGAFPTLSTYIFPDIVLKIRDTMPNLKLILIEEKTVPLVEQLKKGVLDAALVALPIHDDVLSSHALFDDPFVLAVGHAHPLAKRKTISQSELVGHKLLLLEEGHCLRDQALDVCQMTSSDNRQDVRATGLETIRQMVKANAGITLIPTIAIRPDDHGITYIPFTPPTPKRTIGILWRKTTTRIAVIEQLIQMLSPS